MSRLIIVMEGGLVQGVITDDPQIRQDLEVITLDYDVDNEDEDNVIDVPQTIVGGYEPARVWRENVEVVGADYFKEIVEQLDNGRRKREDES